MRYTSAVVLSTLAIGQAAAHNARHASFHARRQGEAKRDIDKVNWNKVSYDLDNVDWSSVFGKPAATPAPAAGAPPAYVAEVKTSEAPSTTEAAYTPAPTSQEEKPTETESESAKPTSGGIIGDIMEGVDALCEKLGVAQPGKNDHEDNGNIWLGSSSDWVVEFQNDASESVVVFCWTDDNFAGMSINKNQPWISANLSPGQAQNVSFAAGAASACAPAYPSSKLAMFGGLDETWFEVTFGQWGAFDISRNVNMGGSIVEAKGSKCESTLDKCVFKCTGGRSTCEKGYTLDNCNAGNGGGGGYDPVMQGVGGGCAMGESSEHINVSLKGPQ